MSTTQELTVGFEVPEGYILIGYRQPRRGDLWLNEELQKVYKMDEMSWSTFKPIVELAEPTSITIPNLTLTIAQAEMLYAIMNSRIDTVESVLDDLGYNEQHTHCLARDMKSDNSLTAKAIRDTFIAQEISNGLMGV